MNTHKKGITEHWIYSSIHGHGFLQKQTFNDETQTSTFGEPIKEHDFAEIRGVTVPVRFDTRIEEYVLTEKAHELLDPQ